MLLAYNNYLPDASCAAALLNFIRAVVEDGVRHIAGQTCVPFGAAPVLRDAEEN